MEKIKLRIHTWPEKILRKKCRRVEKVDALVRQNLEEMLILLRSLAGMGLAANQAGLEERLIVIEVKEKLFKLVNPRIVKKEGSISFPEGCLSFPGLELEIKRADKIWVSAWDESGRKIEIEARGLLSVIFQHEIDHINGRLFIDRVSLLKRLQIIPKLRAIAKKLLPTS